MKKRHMLLWMLAGISVLGIFFAVGYTHRQTVYEPEKISTTSLAEDDVSIWVVNDMHYLAPELKDDGEAFEIIRKTAAGKDLVYQDEAMQALVWHIEREQPKFLLVNGDLTLNGELASAEKLADYFEQIEQAGTEVLVNPGNHDLSNGWARQFSKDEQIKIPSLEPDEYVELFADYGVDLAAFQDSHTLSYVAAVREDYWIAMLDANQYTPTTGKGPAPAGGRLPEETISWLKDVFTEADKEGAKVLPVMHHNTLSHNSVVRENYAIANGDQLATLLAESSTNVVLTAHVHSQDIIKSTRNGHDLYDIATGALSIYPGSIGNIVVNEEGFSYERLINPVEEWAEESGETNLEVLKHQDYLKKLFVQDGRIFGGSSVYEEQWEDKSRVEDVMEYVGQANVRFFAGEDYVPEEEWDDVEKQLKEDTVYPHIKEQSAGRLLRYLDSILMDDNMEDTEFHLPFE